MCRVKCSKTLTRRTKWSPNTLFFAAVLFWTIAARAEGVQFEVEGSYRNTKKAEVVDWGQYIKVGPSVQVKNIKIGFRIGQTFNVFGNEDVVRNTVLEGYIQAQKTVRAISVMARYEYAVDMDKKSYIYDYAHQYHIASHGRTKVQDAYVSASWQMDGSASPFIWGHWLHKGIQAAVVPITIQAVRYGVGVEISERLNNIPANLRVELGKRHEELLVGSFGSTVVHGVVVNAELSTEVKLSSKIAGRQVTLVPTVSLSRYENRKRLDDGRDWLGKQRFGESFGDFTFASARMKMVF